MANQPVHRQQRLHGGIGRLPVWLRSLFVGLMLLLIAGMVALSTFQQWASLAATVIVALGTAFTFLQYLPTLFPVASSDTITSPTQSPLDAFPVSQQGVLSGSNTLPSPLTSEMVASAHDVADTLSSGQVMQLGQLQPEDIFLFCVNLPRSEEFYGRETERITISNRISRHASTSIVGPRRIGKTWLLEYVIQVVQQNHDEHMHIGYIDTTWPDCQKIKGFTARAIKALGGITYANPAEPDLMLLWHFIEEMKALDHTLILCIDEFEGLGKASEFNFNFFSSLRAIAQAGLVLIAASKKPLIDIVGDSGKTSGFFNIFEQLTLEPFSKTEALNFVGAKSLQARFTTQERDRVLLYGQIGEQQWLPLRLQLAGKMLLTDKMLVAQGNTDRYRPDDLNYWQRFEQQLEEKYRGVVR